MPLGMAKPIEWAGIIVHHTDSTHMTLSECNQWHRERGWDECGYNFIISPEGNIITARGFDRKGAHTKGFNSRFLGIAFVGTGKANQNQLDAFYSFLGQLEPYYAKNVSGHSFFGSTECPGEIMNQIRGME